MSWLQRALPTSWRQRLVEALGGTALGGFTGDENDGYTRLSDRVKGGRAWRRDLTAYSQDEMLRIAHFQYTSNALARFLIHTQVAMTVGREVGYTLEFDAEHLKMDPQAAKDLAADARGFLDRWWSHPAHDFKGRGFRYAVTYLVTGEVLLLVSEARNGVDGSFMCDFVDSQAIKDVKGKNGLATTPGTVVLTTSPSEQAKSYQVMLPLPDGTYEGECFFFRHAGRLNSLRGMYDLLPQADWIDMHDQLMFTLTDKTTLANTLVHDLKVEGARDRPTVQAEVDLLRAAIAKPGGIYGHNESIAHEVKTADLGQADNAVLLRQVLLHVLGSKGIPEHWYADAGSSNRASSGEQSDVAFKTLEALQEELLAIFQTPLLVAYDALAERQTRFPRRVDGGVTLQPNLPKIAERDISKVGSVLAQAETALDAAVEGERVSRRTAMRATLQLLETLTGQHVDADDEQERIDAEAAERELRRAELAQQMAQRLLPDQGGGDETPDSLAREGSDETWRWLVSTTRGRHLLGQFLRERVSDDPGPGPEPPEASA
jgi:hypothetical protein